MLSQLSLSAVAFLAASSAMACNSLFEGALQKGQALNKSETVKECKQIPSQRAEQDSAVAYVVSNTNTLYRVFPSPNPAKPFLACQVTTDVLDIKLSQHSQDASLVYFVRAKGINTERNSENGQPVFGSVLYSLKPGADPVGGNCPSNKKYVEQIGYHIKSKGNGDYMFSVLPKEGSNAIVVAQHTHDIIAIWDKEGNSFNAPSVSDYFNNGARAVDFKINATTFMKKGEPGSTILAFVELNNGQVIHVRDSGTARELQQVAMRGGSLAAHVKAVTGK